MNYFQPMRLADYNGDLLIGGTVMMIEHREYDSQPGGEHKPLSIFRRRNGTWPMENPIILGVDAICPGFWYAGCADLIVKDRESVVVFEMNGIGDPPAV